MHWCAYHLQDEPDKNFRIKKNGKLDSWCIEGRNENSRKEYAPIKAEVAEKKAEYESRTEQTCTVCKKTKPIDDFPFRYDRPDRRESRCHDCVGRIRAKNLVEYNETHRESIRENKRDYRKRKPETHRKAGRKRLARKNRVRHESYTDEQIRDRDQGLCYFCKEWVDPSLIYPDLRSEVIHHIHPFAKHGPNIPKNVALAHSQCNNKNKDKYTFVFAKGWSVTPITNQLARQIAKDKHYLHRAPNTSYAFGLFQDGDKDPQGIVIFGSPSSGRITKSICSIDLTKVIELNRLWCHDDAPFGAASWLVSKALKSLPPYIVVAYADTGITDTRNGRSHDGSIYRALSFNYAGQSKPSKDWRLPGSTRNVGKKTPGSICHEVTPKNRFWTVTGNKKEKKILRSMCEWPSLPYDQTKEPPKGGS
jgi:hypothetical protein